MFRFRTQLQFRHQPVLQTTWFWLTVLVGISLVRPETGIAESASGNDLRLFPNPGSAVSFRLVGLPRRSQSTSEIWQPQAAVRPWKYIVVHHSATTSGSIEDIHEEHRRRKDAAGNPWLGIGYHFVIGNGRGMKDGAALPTFRWKQQLHGAHCGNAKYNGVGIGICLIGNLEERPPTDLQRQTLVQLIRHLSRTYDIRPAAVIGHNFVKPTLCPGRHLKLDRIIQDAAITGRAY